MQNSAQDFCRFHYSQIPDDVRYVVVVLVEMDSLS